MAYLVETNYRGAHLAVEFEDGNAGLRINGLVRERAPLPSAGSTLRLASTVQTDYEWHEFIEAVIEIREDAIETTVNANGQAVSSDTCPASEVQPS